MDRKNVRTYVRTGLRARGAVGASAVAVGVVIGAAPPAVSLPPAFPNSSFEHASCRALPAPQGFAMGHLVPLEPLYRDLRTATYVLLFLGQKSCVYLRMFAVVVGCVSLLFLCVFILRGEWAENHFWLECGCGSCRCGCGCGCGFC